MPPTFPDGLDTEVFSFAALGQAWREASLTSEREHVTSYIWKNPDRFRLANVANTIDLSALGWTVDERADLEFVRAVYHRLHCEDEPPFGMNDVLALLDRKPRLRDLNKDFARNEGYTKSLLKDKEFKTS
jgi:spore coat polysaccharide biosynthesis protein SpsF